MRDEKAAHSVSIKAAFIIILAMLAAIVTTRAVSLTHNMFLHPDEYVFFDSARSLAELILGRTDQYIIQKEYCEGGIILQLPFQLFFLLVGRAGGVTVSAQLCGRIASLTYFCFGAVLGCIVLWKFIDRRPMTVIVYAFTVVFSLLHMEQSRYATGEAASFFLLMAVILLTGIGLSCGKRNVLCLCLAAFLSGALCAVKYPQLFFASIPLWAVCRYTAGEKPGKRAKVIVGAVILMITGIFALSPAAARDPGFFYRAISKETTAYLVEGNLCEVGGAKNHIVSLVLYTLLYSGFPLALLFLSGEFVSGWKNCRRTQLPDTLFRRVIPVVITVFFTYNLFVKTLFMRTYYPFFFIGDLYVAAAAGRLSERSRAGKALTLLLCALMAVRGGFFAYALTEKSGIERLETLIDGAVDENWNETLILTPGYVLLQNTDELKNVKFAEISDEAYADADALRVQEGQLIITGCEDHSRCNPYVFPVESEAVNRSIDRWATFKELNAASFRGRVYPEYYYWLFGWWIKGTTGTDYEFPTNYVYYTSLP